MSAPMRHEYIPRMMDFEPSDYQVVRRVADQRGFGEKGFSAALRLIIREWQELQIQYPAHMNDGGIHYMLAKK